MRTAGSVHRDQKGFNHPSPLTPRPAALRRPSMRAFILRCDDALPPLCPHPVERAPIQGPARFVSKVSAEWTPAGRGFSSCRKTPQGQQGERGQTGDRTEFFTTAEAASPKPCSTKSAVSSPKNGVRLQPPPRRHKAVRRARLRRTARRTIRTDRAKAHSPLRQAVAGRGAIGNALFHRMIDVPQIAVILAQRGTSPCHVRPSTT